MQALNLYNITRKIDDKLFPLYERALSDRDNEIKLRKDEIGMITTIVDNLRSCNARQYCYENWFYSFTIPQISKEFDLLKIGLDNKIINVEIKGQEVAIERIEKQLVQNRYYLSHIATEIYSFTCMRCDESTVKVFKYDGDSLQESTMDELIHCITQIEESLTSDIDNLFTPKDYLISPLNTPEKFLKEQYYLNSQQEEIKKKICGNILQNAGLWGIRGSAGTGKTLLLYDIAKELAKDVKVGVVHCGQLNEGHTYLNTHMENVSIIDAKTLTEEWLSECIIVCVDETQRLYKSGVDMILQAFSDERIQGCIFSYDPAQALSIAEVNRDNAGRLNAIPEFTEEKLTDRIRTNEEICYFIQNILRLHGKQSKRVQYKNVEVLYANNEAESDEIVRCHIRNGYFFITLTPSRYVSNSIDHYSNYVNSHQVIGQEFDKVVAVIDNNFRYSEQGELEGKPHPNPDYLFPRLFYQNISRAREKLCLVILNNPDVFEKLLRVKEHCLNYSSEEIV